MKNNKYGTYLITFCTGEKFVFGNNYKPWWQHATEFIYHGFGNKTLGWRYEDVIDVVTNVQFSNQQFYDDGGLKWCSLEAYQEVANEVCKNDGLAPVNISKIVFKDSPTDRSLLNKKLKEY